MKVPFSLDKLKKLEKSHLLIGLLAGILLLVIAIPVEEKEDEIREDAVLESTAAREEENYDTYVKNLQRQLEKILENMEGVGEVQVMITLKDQGEAVVEKDITRTQESTSEEDAQGLKRENSSSSAQEETLYVEEDSARTPFVAKEVCPQVEGVLVVAQGGGSSVVAKNISEAVLALFPVEVHKIKVVNMK